MVKKKEKNVEIENISVQEESPSLFQKIKWWLELITAVITIFGLVFGIGYWAAWIEYKVEIMNLNQKHNYEMYELQIKMNYQIQSMQNKYDILESKYNALKERREDNHGK